MKAKLELNGKEYEVEIGDEFVKDFGEEKIIKMMKLQQEIMEME